MYKIPTYVHTSSTQAPLICQLFYHIVTLVLYETIRTSRKLSKGKVLFWRPRGATRNYVLMNDTHLNRQIQVASQY